MTDFDGMGAHKKENFLFFCACTCKKQILMLK